MTQIRKTLGFFLVSGNKIHVSDPCYDYTCSGATTLDNVLSGEYLATITFCNMKSWETSTLSINHVDYANVSPENFIGNVTVDSGQIGFFDDLYYRQNQGGKFGDTDSFYGFACSLTLSKNHGGIIHNRGVVSDTAFGDGTYNLFCAINHAKKIVAASIVFVTDDELEES